VPRISHSRHPRPPSPLPTSTPEEQARRAKDHADFQAGQGYSRLLQHLWALLLGLKLDEGIATRALNQAWPFQRKAAVHEQLDRIVRELTAVRDARRTLLQESDDYRAGER
jgi:hypothetical protein